MGMARPNQAFQGQQFQGGPNKGGGTAVQQAPFGGQSSYGTQTGWGQPQQQQATNPFQGFQAPQYSGESPVQGGGFGQPQQQFQGGPNKGGGGLFGNVPSAPAPWQAAPAMGALPDLDRLGAGIPPLQTANLYNQMRIGGAPAIAPPAPAPWQTPIAPPPLAPWQTSLPVDALGGYDRMPTREFSLPVIQPQAPSLYDPRTGAAITPSAASPLEFDTPDPRIGREIFQPALAPLPSAPPSIAPLDRIPEFDGQIDFQDRTGGVREAIATARDPYMLGREPLEMDRRLGDVLEREPLIDRRIAEEPLSEREDANRQAREASLAKRLGITGDQYADQVERERADRGLAPRDFGLEEYGGPARDVGLEEYGGLERDDARRQMERDMEMDMEMDMARDASRRQARDQQKRLAFEQQLGQRGLDMGYMGGGEDRARRQQRFAPIDPSLNAGLQQRLATAQQLGQLGGQQQRMAFEQQLGQRGSPIGWQQALGGLGGARPQMRRPIPVPRKPRVRKPIR
tara:strand:- start:740 stop:2278 length:1539 start_codon:yes stop_codon:yes gene_type:complete